MEVSIRNGIQICSEQRRNRRLATRWKIDSSGMEAVEHEHEHVRLHRQAYNEREVAIHA